MSHIKLLPVRQCNGRKPSHNHIIMQKVTWRIRITGSHLQRVIYSRYESPRVPLQWKIPPVVIASWCVWSCLPWSWQHCVACRWWRATNKVHGVRQVLRQLWIDFSTMGTSGVWLVHSENFKTNAIPGVLRERRQNKWFKLRFHKRGMRKRYALRVSDNKWINRMHSQERDSICTCPCPIC